MHLTSLLATVAAIAVLIPASSLHAGASGNPYASPDVVIAAVRKAADAPATRGNPPVIELEILESLRGDYRTGDVTRAIWQPPPHDIDTGGREAELKRWSETPMDGPKAGEKFILFGTRDAEKKQPVFLVRTEANLSLSDENKARAVKIVEEARQRLREMQDRRAAEAQRTAEALGKWKESLTPERLSAMARESDLIAVGQIETEMIAAQPLIYVRPDKVLKQPADVGKLRTLILPVSAELQGILNRESSYVLFVKWPGKGGVPGQWEVTPASGEGIAIGDEKTLAVVGEAIGKK